MPSPSSFNILYEFTWSDGRKREYLLKIERDTLLLSAPDDAQKREEWTQLKTEKCNGCPLQEAEHPFCPTAVQLSALIDSFKDEKSHVEVAVSVVTPERTFQKTVPLQRGVQSIFGVIMATSGCPVTAFLRPMARFHLPFSNTEETIMRTVSFYFLSQYFAGQQGKAQDWELSHLDQYYQRLSEINQAMSRRIHKAKNAGNIQASGDAMPNAIVILDTFAQMLSMEISEKLPILSYLYKSPSGG